MGVIRSDAQPPRNKETPSFHAVCKNFRRDMLVYGDKNRLSDCSGRLSIPQVIAETVRKNKFHKFPALKGIM